MFYDFSGKPNVNGQYELRDGRLTRRASAPLRQGDYIGFQLDMVDSAPRGSVFLTDAQRPDYSEMRKVVNQIRDARYLGYPGLPGNESPRYGAEAMNDARPAIPAGDLRAALRAARYQ